ncbi:mechanosensitive ion channel family protein [Rufibacter roseus]|uniref:Mechanosensitive ion channel family protein n=1 Tax=Rufibacter roseus TaxID=1567108 RepID=A0ABW2DM84_9BACT
MNSLFWLVAALLLAVAPAQGQLLPESKKEEAPAAPEWPEDSLGRRTPRGTVSGFIQAVANENYTRAAHYLKLDRTLKRKRGGPELAQALQRLLDVQGNIYPYSRLSEAPEGLVEDNLGPNLEKVGTATLNGETFDLILEKTEGPKGAPLWLFSSQTVQRIPLGFEPQESELLVDSLLPVALQENKWGGVPIGHWLIILLLAVLTYAFAWFVTSSLLYLIRMIWPKAGEEPTEGIIKAFALPIRLYLAVWIFVAASQQIGISIIVRQRFSEVTIIVGLAALLLLLWQLIDAVSRFSERRLTRRGNMAGVSAVLFFKRGIKIAFFAFGFIVLLDSLGFDVTAGIAALGIGGIALALGAQKTVENFVGSVTLIADQPVRVGDFCKVGDIVGTVEQIGMRSTRLRTLNRTIVTIPNGEFSSLKIENFAHRDQFLFNPTFGLRFETTPEQIRYLLVELRSILYAHPKVDPEPARIRFTKIGADSLNLEVFAYIHAADFSGFLEVQEDILLRMMDIIEASGTGFAFPSQTLYLARDKGLSEEKGKQSEEKVRQWRESGEIPIPNFDYEQIQKLRNTIQYPPEGSSVKDNEAPV